MPRVRLDQWLVKSGRIKSRAEARRLIMTGKVCIKGQVADKCGSMIDPQKVEPHIILKKSALVWVSRGGLKLEAAISHFNINLEGIIAADLGASTGGFTDVMLHAGVSRVFAVDVGYGIIDWKLRNDSRVVVMERVNARNLTLNSFDTPHNGQVDFITADLSFIGLVKVMNIISQLLITEGRAVLLVKPQFEAGREFVGRGGIVKEPRARGLALQKVCISAEKNDLLPQGIIASPIKGAEGNQEYLLYLQKGGIYNRAIQNFCRSFVYDPASMQPESHSRPRSEDYHIKVKK